MSEQDSEDNRIDIPAGAAPAVSGPDRGRRRLTAGGLAGAGILMTLSSRSALGQTMGGCGSESVSAALSRSDELPACGCSPGFWWSPDGQQVWSEYLETAFPMGTSFNALFCAYLPPDVKPFFKDDAVTVAMVKKDGGSYPETNYTCNGNAHAVGMHTVAALLNVQFYGERYPASPPFGSADDVIVAFQEALANGDDGLILFKDRVDVYDGLWCFNGMNWRDGRGLA